MANPVLSIKILADASQAKAELGNTAKSVDKWQAGAAKMALPAAAIGGAVALAAKQFSKLAAEAEQNVGAVDTVFKGAADQVHAFGAQAAGAVGLSKSAYEGLAASIGGSLASAGYSQDELATKTDGLIGAAADLSSVFGGDVAEASGSMGAALRGEFDSLERFGVFLNATAVKAELAKRGQDKLTGAAGEAAKKQATQSLILEQAAKYQGNFAREADTAAGAQQRATAQIEDAQAKLGEAFLPVIVKVSEAVAGMAGYVAENSGAFTALGIAVAAIAAGILLFVGIMKVITAATTAWSVVTKIMTAGQIIFNAVMAANPIILIVLAIMAVIAALVLAYMRFTWFRNAVNAIASAVAGVFSAAWSTISRLAGVAMTAAGAAWGRLTGAIGAIVKRVQELFSGAWEAVVRGAGAIAERIGAVLEPVRRVVETITGAIGSIAEKASGALGWIGSKLSFNAELVPVVSLPATDGLDFFMTAAYSGGGPARWARPNRGAPISSTVIHVHGALDPVAVGRQLTRILNGQAVRSGALLVGGR